MSDSFTITIDGRTCSARKGQTILQVARAHGVFIPTLCDFEGLEPAGTCRICTVKVNGRPMAACTSAAAPGMEIENDTPELTDYRKMLLEMLFVEGNHFCPACEKSGSCQLQALAYRYRILAPRFSYFYTPRPVDASAPNLLIEHNRCILCKRCVRGIKTADGKAVFAFHGRGSDVDIAVDQKHARSMTEAQAQQAMDMCPVGALIRKRKGFDIPIGKRIYDCQPIGSELQAAASADTGSAGGKS